MEFPFNEGITEKWPKWAQNAFYRPFGEQK